MHCTTDLCPSVNQLKKEKTVNNAGAQRSVSTWCAFRQLLKLRTLTRWVADSTSVTPSTLSLQSARRLTEILQSSSRFAPDFARHLLRNTRSLPPNLATQRWFQNTTFHRPRLFMSTSTSAPRPRGSRAKVTTLNGRSLYRYVHTSFRRRHMMRSVQPGTGLLPNLHSRLEATFVFRHGF